MEMEIILSSVWNLCGNRMDCSVEFQGGWNGKRMEINLYLRWNSNGMEWKLNQNGICKCYNNLRNIIHNSSNTKN